MPSRLTILSLAVLLLAGCTAAPVATDSMPREALFPTLKLNDDLFKSFQPSNDREWAAELAKMPEAEFHGNEVTIRNIRDCHWESLDKFTPAYHDETFNLDKLRSVDFVVVPFNEMPSIGHTMLSFGFEGGEQLAVSVEIRRERGQAYSPIAGFLRQYELIYIAATENDVIGRRVKCDLSDVYLYRSTATPEQARELFVDVMHRANKLAKEPEFYNTVTNNCTTNIRNHINHLKPNEVPYDYRVLLPGYSDKLAYDLGLIERHGSYEQTRLRARVNYAAYLHRDTASFSRAIRR